MTSILSKATAAALALAILAGTTLGSTQQAEAKNGGAIVAGVAAGIFLGAAAAAAAQPHYYAAPVYAEPEYEPVYVPACKKVLVEDAYGNVYKKKVCH